MLRSATVCLFLGLASFGLTPTPVKAAEPDLTGHYRAEGTFPDGGDYTQHVHIVKQDEVYFVKWTKPDDKSYLSEGVGILKDGMLAVTWHGSSQGVAIYSVERGDKGPKLVGKWAYSDSKGQVGRETLHFERE